MRLVGKTAGRAEPRERAPEAEVAEPGCREKPLSDEDRVTVPQTDTGRRVENTQANGGTFVKELGKLAP
jgi:hypothetical protein